MKCSRFLAGILLFPALVTGAAVAHAETTTTTYWAKGVGANGGWYDVDKTDAEGDDLMCYAASASNLIAWWQNMQPSVPSGTPTKVDDIFDRYKSASATKGELGGDTGWALAWWISGVYLPENETEAARWVVPNVKPEADSSDLAAFEGYYASQLGLTAEQMVQFCGAHTEVREGKNYVTSSYSPSYGKVGERDFGTLLTSGYGIGLGLEYTKEGKTGAHAVTLWGAEYDDSGNLLKLWLTDSDDAQKENWHEENDGLFAATVEMLDGVVYLTTKKDEQWVNGTKLCQGTWYSAEGNYHIDSVFLLDSTAFSVPEPATATLGLLALTGLAVRRRRR